MRVSSALIWYRVAKWGVDGKSWKSALDHLRGCSRGVHAVVSYCGHSGYVSLFSGMQQLFDLLGSSISRRRIWRLGDLRCNNPVPEAPKQPALSGSMIPDRVQMVA